MFSGRQPAGVRGRLIARHHRAGVRISRHRPAPPHRPDARAAGIHRSLHAKTEVFGCVFGASQGEGRAPNIFEEAWTRRLLPREPAFIYERQTTAMALLFNNYAAIGVGRTRMHSAGGPDVCLRGTDV